MRNKISKFHHDIRTCLESHYWSFSRHEPDPETNNNKKQIKSMKNDLQKKILEIIGNEISSEERKQNDLNLETGASSWPPTLPIKEEGYILNKQSFWHLLSIRYGWKLKRIPSHCACGNTFNLQHALQCPIEGFVTLRYNHIRNKTTSLLTEVCKDVRVEPQMQPLNGETFSEKTANKSDQGRVDVSARNFWLTGQVAIFDVRVFNPTSKRYVNLEHL